MLAAIRTTSLRSLRAQQPKMFKGVRAIHIENTVGNNTPFSYANPGAFGFKIVAFTGLGFSIPFIAAGYQLHKASA